MTDARKRNGLRAVGGADRLPLRVQHLLPRPADPDFLPTEYGTGVVVDRGGLVLTAYHVLGGGSDYYVTTRDRKVYKAWVKAADPRSDLAVLSIDATDLGGGCSGGALS